MDKASTMLRYAVEQCGYDRTYRVSFADDMSPMVRVFDSDVPVITYGADEHRVTIDRHYLRD
jgi:hypothetical protein